MRASYIKIAAAFIGVLLLAIFLVRPGVTGYSVYQKVRDSGLEVDEYTNGLKELKMQVEESMDELETCREYGEKTLERFDIATQKAQECQSSLDNLKNELDDVQSELGDEVDELLQELSKEEERAEEFKKRYYELAKKEADVKCCKARVDDKRIDSYKIVDEEIICDDDGEHKIEC